MTAQITIQHTSATAPTRTERALTLAATFGLDVDNPAHLCRTVINRCTVPIPRGGIIFITGPSGGGKSTMIRHIVDQLARTRRVLDLNTIALRSTLAVIDQIDAPLNTALEHLSRAGLAEAHTLLHTPPELSDGQRARLKLAIAFERAAANDNEPALIIADEFAAALDRTTASTVSRSVRRWISRTPHTLIAATTHDDLFEHLDPDVLIHKDLSPDVTVIQRKPCRAHD